MATGTDSFMIILRRTFLLCAAALLTACSSLPCARLSINDQICLAALPANPPFNFRREQVSALSAQGPQVALSEIEWQSNGLHLAALSYTGQRLYALHYDGKTINWQPGLMPMAVPPENLLLDFQLVWWPLELLRPQLPKGWRLSEIERDGILHRELHDQNALVLSIIFHDGTQRNDIEFIQHKLQYQLRLTGLVD